MPENPKPDREERGIVNDVIVPLAQSGVGGAVAAVVGNKLNKSNETPPPNDNK